MYSQAYERQSVTIGAFATDLQVLALRSRRRSPSRTSGRGKQRASSEGTAPFRSPVRGDASVTWMNHQCGLCEKVEPTGLPGDPTLFSSSNCDEQNNDGRCAASFHAGNNSNESRQLRATSRCPVSPSEWRSRKTGKSLVITHQTDTKASLLVNRARARINSRAVAPVRPRRATDRGQWRIFDSPRSRARLRDVRRATSSRRGRHSFGPRGRRPEVHRLRYYSDDGYTVGVSNGTAPPTLYRPYLLDEAKVPR